MKTTKCKRCGKKVKVDTKTIFEHIAPVYAYKCQKCGYCGYVYVDEVEKW